MISDDDYEEDVVVAAHPKSTKRMTVHIASVKRGLFTGRTITRGFVAPTEGDDNEAATRINALTADEREALWREQREALAQPTEGDDE